MADSVNYFKIYVYNKTGTIISNNCIKFCVYTIRIKRVISI